MRDFSTISSAALFMAGLAFFFHGLDGVRDSLKSMAGRTFRKRVARLTASGPLAAFWGFVLGALAQSASAASFIVSGFVSSRLLPLRRGLTMVAWANLGTVVLPFVASFDIRTAITLVLGLGGLLAVSKPGRALMPAWRGAFMLGLLMLGLEFLKEATGPIPQQPWFREAAAQVDQSLAFGFLLGLLARMVIQSTSAIVIIAVTLSTNGILDTWHASMIVHGAGVGVGLSVLVLGGSARGLPRQLAYFQAIINTAAGALLAMGAALSKYGGLPNLLDLLRSSMGMDPSRTLAVVFLVQQAITVVAAQACASRWEQWLAWLSPLTSAQSLATPQFIGQGAGMDAASFLDLAKREQQRIIDAIPDLLDAVRADGERDAAECTRDAESCHALGAEIQDTLHELSQSRLDREDSEELLALDIRQRTIDQLIDELVRFTAAVAAERRQEEAAGVAHGTGLLFGMTEGLHLVLMQLSQATRDHAPDDIAMLSMIAGDRGDLVEQLRAEIVTSSAAGGGTGLQFAMALFERSIWLVGKLAPPMPPEAAAPEGTATSESGSATLESAAH